MVAVGLHHNYDIQSGSGRLLNAVSGQHQSTLAVANLEPQVLFVYPPDKQLPFQRRNFNLEEKIVCSVEQGDKCRFWENKWESDTSLKHRFPLLYKMAGNKGSRIIENYKRVRNEII